jgi:mannose-6-phosphate isomerase
MPKLDIPLQLSPVFKPKIWGQRHLAPLFTRPQGSQLRGNPLPGRSGSQGSEGDPIGEVWLTDDEERFLNGPLVGFTLDEASENCGPELHGRRWGHRRFPILAKYIYTSDWLSVQVHPDDNYALLHEPGHFGKCEMWYIVHADQGAQILLGLRPGVTKERLNAEFEKGTCRELLYRFHPKAREAIFVPPGTVHALGPGLVLFEAEENSDLTYRLDDFGRVGLNGKPRPLHWAKGLDVARVELPAYRDLPQIEFREAYGSRRYVLASRFFAVEELSLEKRASFEGFEERVEVLSLLEGEGRVETHVGWLAYRTGDTWLIPPATGRYRLVPNQKTRLLKFYVPDLDRDFRRALARRGVSSAKINKIVFD